MTSRFLAADKPALRGVLSTRKNSTMSDIQTKKKEKTVKVALRGGALLNAPQWNKVSYQSQLSISH
jgi:hypothetical protein